VNDQMLKAAAEVGRRRALHETTSKLKDELHRRLKKHEQNPPTKKPEQPKPPRADSVGWKEQSLGKAEA
jgi:hypothetical protein